jgi:hypothetical protein
MVVAAVPAAAAEVELDPPPGLVLPPAGAGVGLAETVGTLDGVAPIPWSGGVRMPGDMEGTSEGTAEGGKEAVAAVGEFSVLFTTVQRQPDSCSHVPESVKLEHGIMSPSQ